MSLEIFKLVGSIFVDSDKANESLSKTDKKASSVASTFKNGAAAVGKFSVGVVTAAVSAGTAIVGLAKNASDAADNIDKMSQKLGLSREAYQELDFICSQSGASVDSLQAGMKKLVNVMDTTRDGTSKSATALEQLGIAATDADGNLRNSEDVMWESLSALQAMTNETEKAKLATELFGKSGTELMPLLNGASGSIEEMKNQAHELGLIMSDEFIDNGVNLQDSLDQTKRALKAIGLDILTTVMPIVESVSDYIQQALPTIRELLSGLTPVITQIAGMLLPMLTDLASNIFPILIDVIGQLLPLFMEIVNLVLPILIETISEILPILTNLIGSVLPILLNTIQLLLPFALQIIDLILPALVELLEILEPLIVMIIETLLPILTDALLQILPPLLEIASVALPILMDAIRALVPVVEWAINLAGNMLQTWLGVVINVVDKVKNVFLGIVSFFKKLFSGDFRGAFMELSNIVQNIMLALVEFVKYPINQIITVINGFISGLNNIQIPDWVPVVGGKGINISQIPMLYNGGEVTESGRVLVGEKGPEFLDLPRGARVVPLDKSMESGNEAYLLEQILEVLNQILASNVRIDLNKREFGRLVRDYA